MAVSPVLYESDDATAATDITATIARGGSSSTYTKHLWNEGDETLRDAYLKVIADDGSGTFVDTGVPILDEQYVKVAITGVNNTADASLADQTSDTIALGNGSLLALPDLPPTTAVHFTVDVDVPASASESSATLRLALVYGNRTLALTNDVTTVASGGVVPEYRDLSARKVVEGFAITASGTADVIVEKGQYDYDGKRYAKLQETETLDQNDSAPAALGSGESYIAVISIGEGASAVTVTKGTKGASPTAPATPANEIYLGQVTVDYDAGGTSTIIQGDVSQSALVRGDMYAEASTGLSIDIHSGTCLTENDAKQRVGAIDNVSLTANSTNYVYQLTDGTRSANTTGVPPSNDAQLLFEATTDGSSVTDIEDKRVFLDRPMLDFVPELPLYNENFPSLSPPVTIDRFVLPQGSEWELIDVALDLDVVDGSWSAGGVTIDLFSIAPGGDFTAAGTTIYTNSGTDDERPRVAYDATNYRSVSKYHEVRRFAGGTRFLVKLVEVPTTSGGNHSIWVHPRFRRVR